MIHSYEKMCFLTNFKHAICFLLVFSMYEIICVARSYMQAICLEQYSHELHSVFLENPHIWHGGIEIVTVMRKNQSSHIQINAINMQMYICRIVSLSWG